MTLRDHFEVGDVITVNDSTVPLDLRDKFFRVVAIDGEGVKLSRPYLDQACTMEYHPPYPRRRP